MEIWRKPVSYDGFMIWLFLVAFIFYVISNGIKSTALIWVLSLLIIVWFDYIVLFLRLFKGTIGFIISGNKVVDNISQRSLSITKSFQYGWVHARRVLASVFRMGRLSGGGRAFISNNTNEEDRCGVKIV